MRRRRQKNTLLPKMLGLAVLINAILLPILAQFGVFKSIGRGQRLTPIELVKAPPPEKRPARRRRRRSRWRRLSPPRRPPRAPPKPAARRPARPRSRWSPQGAAGRRGRRGCGHHDFGQRGWACISIRPCPPPR